MDENEKGNNSTTFNFGFIFMASKFVFLERKLPTNAIGAVFLHFSYMDLRGRFDH